MSFDMNSRTLVRSTALALTAILAVGCGSSAPRSNVAGRDATGTDETGTGGNARASREAPPESGKPRDVSFPPIQRGALDNGLELNTVEWAQLPIVYAQLVIKSGAEADPEQLKGLSHLVAAMLEEGTKKRTSAQLADEVEFLGADLWTSSDEENIYVGIRALREHLDRALEIVADVAMNPSFREDELRKLKRRELDRLALQANDPSFLAHRELHRVLYGPHPYANVDTTPDIVNRVKRTDLVGWHQKHFLPNNAFLVVVGETNLDAVKQASEKAFGRWKTGTPPEPAYAEPPSIADRRVVVIDRPESVQSVLYLGNLALPRSSEDWVPLMVANQVLGGSASSRLFMDLRERRSLTYGAYSRVDQRVQVAPFAARASVRNEVTREAVDALFEHLERIASEAPPDRELANAKRYLSDSFPLRIDTPGKILSLVSDLRVFGLPDDYWEGYRSRIGTVQAPEALAAAQRFIRPSKMVVVVVGRAADVVEPLRKWGPVTVLDTSGKEVRTFEATAPKEGSPPAARTKN